MTAASSPFQQCEGYRQAIPSSPGTAPHGTVQNLSQHPAPERQKWDTAWMLIRVPDLIFQAFATFVATRSWNVARPFHKPGTRVVLGGSYRSTLPDKAAQQSGPITSDSIALPSGTI